VPAINLFVKSLLCHFWLLGTQSEEERPGVPRVHSQVHGGMEQGLVCESQPPDQPW
jgi:hypothetical protein